MAIIRVERLNLCLPVRSAIEAMGASTVRVVNALNAAIGQMKQVGDGKVSGGNISATKKKFTTSEGLTFKYEGKRGSMPLEFAAWHDIVARANKLHEFETIGIPSVFNEWLAKFKPQAETQTEPQVETQGHLANHTGEQ